MDLHTFFNISIVLSLVCPIMIWAMLLGFLLAILFAIEDGVKRLQRLHQIPCDRCIYHTGSPYLRCPVHPLSAFSEDAICCRDFEPAHGCPAHQPTQPIEKSPFCVDQARIRSDI